MSEVRENQEPMMDGDEYRSLSVGAVIVTIIGLFSFLALVSPLLWFVPVLTILLGALVLRSLARNSEMSGRRGVVLAITLAVFFGAWAPARHFSREWQLYSDARELADEWLDLVCSKRLQEAHQLHLQPTRRLEGGQSLDEFYESNSMAKEGMKMLYEGKPLSVIIGQEEDPTFEFLNNVAHVHNGLEDTLILRYAVHYEENQQPVSLPIEVIVICTKNRRSGRHDWHVAKAQSVDS